MLLSIISFLFLINSVPLQAQYLDRATVSGFGNLENNAFSDNSYYGVYLNYFIHKTETFMYGPYASGGISGNSDASGYQGNAKEIGGGILLGWFSNNLFGNNNFDTWFSPSIGVKYNKDNGNVSLYSGEQEDWLLQAGLDFSLWKRDVLSIFPRIQLNVNTQIPISEQKTAYWDNVQIKDPVWNKGFLSISGKLSLVNIPISGIFISPKLIGLYNFSKGDRQSTFGPGIELSIHKPNRDDFVSVYCLYKLSNINADRLTVGLIINFSAL